MAICSMCGKRSLLPERLGDADLCQKCLLKLNAPLWRYRTFENYQVAEKQREKVLSHARKLNCPQEVLDGIVSFFDGQVDGMARCSVCHETVRSYELFGGVNICMKCLSKINTTEWHREEYESRKDLEKDKEKTLRIAQKNGFPQCAIDEIVDHYNNKVEADWLFTIDGGVGQTLKVYESYCILDTDSDFDVNEISKKYGRALKRRQPQEDFITNDDAKSLARDVLTGGVVKAGVHLATSVAINAAADKFAPTKGVFRVLKGSFTIDYDEYNQIEFCENEGEDSIGYIRFRNSQYGGSLAEDIVFFSNSDEDEAYEEICRQVSKMKKAAKKTMDSIDFVQLQEPSHAQSQSVSQSSAADEILKYKNLLDIGAITQEEYDAKKKVLLGL